ncbi:hypothetical protein LZ30DRAFT_587694 [Colletotrichum cereale]|nr:hypothetical protein LZ30DRAFT_587694 [Colletotrichum cereale]
MVPTSAIVLLPLLVSAVQGLRFTGPDVGTKLNLSAPITVTWEHERGEGTEAGWTELDLWWHGGLVGGTSFGYALETNMSVSEAGGRQMYEWDPASVREALAGNAGKLSAGKDYYFAATLHPPNATAPSGTSYSEEYAVEDKSLVVSSASTASPLWGLVLSSLAVSAALL